MDNTESLLELLQSEDRMPPAMRNNVNERAKAFLEAITPDAEHFIRGELDYEIHTAEEVRTLVQSIPGALLMKNYDGMYPIQSITWDYSDDGFNAKAIPFVPLLAEEGMKLNVGGDGMRGGVLIRQCNDIECDSILEELFSVHQSEEVYLNEHKRKEIERICLDAIMSLQRKGLFRKEDIKQYNILTKACHPSSIDRFQYAVRLDPEALINVRQSAEDRIPCLLNNIIQEGDDIEVFELAFKALLQYFPNELGFIFHRGQHGMTLYQEACHLYGKHKTWKIVQRSLEGMDGKEEIFETNAFISISEAIQADELDLLYYLLQHHPVVLERSTSWIRKRKR